MGGGQLGLGDTSDRNLPTAIASTLESANLGPLFRQQVAQISSRSLYHNVLFTDSGKVFTTGMNNKGQLGFGDTTDRSSFTEVTALRGVTPRQVATGTFGSALLATNGALYMWGDNGFNQLHEGDDSDYLSPSISNASLYGGSSITAVALGGYNSYVLTADGSLHMRGLNSEGQFGLGSDIAQATKVVASRNLGVHEALNVQRTPLSTQTRAIMSAFAVRWSSYHLEDLWSQL